MEITNRVVAHATDGRILKGHTQDFSPNRPSFHLHPIEGSDGIELRLKQLKALFFVHTFEGNSHRDDVQGFVDGPPETAQGRKIAIRFRDGELLCGYTLSWAPDRPGFFMFPSDSGSNNQRVFVVTAATMEVKAGPQAEVLAARVLKERKESGVPAAGSAPAPPTAMRPEKASEPLGRPSGLLGRPTGRH